MTLVEGRVALVTGAGSGIGRATALLFGAEGADAVVVSDVNGESAAETTEMLKQAGHEALTVAADVASVEDIEDLINTTVERYGRIDCAVNNAGVRGPWSSILEITDEEWRTVMSVNLDGVFYAMRAEIRAMLKSGGGAIVNISSGATVEPPPRLCPYATSKFGVLGMTRSVAGQFPLENIRVNAVLPGTTRTPMLAQPRGPEPGGGSDAARYGRVAEPEEVAEAIVWLCSPRASWVHGHTMLVDGGTHAYQGGTAIALPAGLRIAAE